MANVFHITEAKFTIDLASSLSDAQRRRVPRWSVFLIHLRITKRQTATTNPTNRTWKKIRFLYTSSSSSLSSTQNVSNLFQANISSTVVSGDVIVVNFHSHPSIPSVWVFNWTTTKHTFPPLAQARFVLRSCMVWMHDNCTCTASMEHVWLGFYYNIEKWPKAENPFPFLHTMRYLKHFFRIFKLYNRHTFAYKCVLFLFT